MPHGQECRLVGALAALSVALMHGRSLGGRIMPTTGPQ